MGVRERLRIGIVSTWFERGAAYVSKAYMRALESRHEVYIYARGGERYAKGDPNWDLPRVTWSKKGFGFRVNNSEMKSWIEENHLDVVFFNEQQDWRIVAFLKRNLPNLPIGAYVDYYTDATVSWFGLYDFLICNTRRHMQAMNKHPQAMYVPWGTDLQLYKPSERSHGQLTFFHSAGMSQRKGTDLLVRVFVESQLGKKSKLIIHTQRPLDWATSLSSQELADANIEVIEKTVGAPGLYYLGDVYVYPTKLDGLGLTMYEALSSGLPVITTDYPPMNEIVDNEVGRLVKVERNYSRSDAYYWPMALCEADDLANQMRWYIAHPEQLKQQKEAARKRAVIRFDWDKNYEFICQAFEQAKCIPVDYELLETVERYYKKETIKALFGWGKPLAMRICALFRGIA